MIKPEEKKKRGRKPKTVKNKKSFLKIPQGLTDAIRSRGKTLLIKYLNGVKLSASQAIYAKCCECSGYWADGIFDCKTPSCPLYDWQLYKGKHSPLKGKVQGGLM